MAVSFPLLSGGRRTTTLRTLLPCCSKPSLVLRVCPSGCVCLPCLHSTILAASVEQFCKQIIDTPLRLLLALEKCLEEVCFCVHQGLRPQRHRFQMLLALDGFVVHRLGFRSFLALLGHLVALPPPATRAPGWLTPWPHRRQCPPSLMRLARCAFSANASER